MTPKLWFIYLGIFAVASFIDYVGAGTYGTLDTQDINDSMTFRVDQEQSGSGFLGLPRQSLRFAGELLPKLITWNFGFLSGPFEIIQYTMIFVLGGLLMITFGTSLLGLLQRNR